MKKEVTIEGIKEINPSQYGGMVSREIRLAAPAEKEIDFEAGIDTIATTEAPAIVLDWNRWEYVREVLPMKYMEAPNNDKVPLLDTHSRMSVHKIMGSAKNFLTQGTDLLCKCFVSEVEKSVRQKIKEGHIDSVSIGYMTDKDATVEVPKNSTVTIDGQEYRNTFTDGIPFVVRTWWKSHELSLVPIGADEAAKFRNEQSGNEKLVAKVKELQQEIEKMKPAENPAPDAGARKKKHELFKLK